MSVQTDFEKEFETEEYEMLILVQASCGGAVCIKDMLKPSVDFLASIDLRNGQFFHEKGRVEWLRFLYKGIIIKHNKTEPTYTKTSLFLCEKRRFFMARTEKGVVTTI